MPNGVRKGTWPRGSSNAMDGTRQGDIQSGKEGRQIVAISWPRAATWAFPDRGGNRPARSCRAALNTSFAVLEILHDAAQERDVEPVPDAKPKREVRGRRLAFRFGLEGVPHGPASRHVRLAI